LAIDLSALFATARTGLTVTVLIVELLRTGVWHVSLVMAWLTTTSPFLTTESFTVARKVTVALPPTGMVRRSAVTVAPPFTVPWVVVADAGTRMVLPGTKSLSVTPPAR